MNIEELKMNKGLLKEISQLKKQFPDKYQSLSGASPSKESKGDLHSYTNDLVELEPKKIGF